MLFCCFLLHVYPHLLFISKIYQVLNELIILICSSTIHFYPVGDCVLSCNTLRMLIISRTVFKYVFNMYYIYTSLNGLLFPLVFYWPANKHLAKRESVWFCGMYKYAAMFGQNMIVKIDALCCESLSHTLSTFRNFVTTVWGVRKWPIAWLNIWSHPNNPCSNGRPNLTPFI